MLRTGDKCLLELARTLWYGHSLQHRTTVSLFISFLAFEHFRPGVRSDGPLGRSRRHPYVHHLWLFRASAENKPKEP